MDLKYYYEIYTKEKFNMGGLSIDQVEIFSKKYGKNLLIQRKKSIFSKIVKALFEPMIIILLFAWVITLGVCISNVIQNREADFFECIGIFLSILLSVGLTVVMESKSEKAFETLKRYSDNVVVKVIRAGKQIIIGYNEVVVGDVVCYEAGDKIVADGVAIETNESEVEESTLTGEARPVSKTAYSRGQFYYENMLFAGTYLKAGSAKCLVLAVGDKAQTGKIASGLSSVENISAPLSQKLGTLSKKISIFGAISALFVFILTLLRLFLINSLSFESVKNAFMDAIILIVAAVPEGLPTTVAISLALSVVKLAKSNAIIKKLIAVETIGSVSVICSDKTGTLTTGNMSVTGFVENGKRVHLQKIANRHVKLNVALNSSAIFADKDLKKVSSGNFTERALLRSFFAGEENKVEELRLSAKVLYRLPFDSKNKYMMTEVEYNGKKTKYYKGSLEKILEICAFKNEESKEIIDASLRYEREAERLLAFAHSVEGRIIFDGYCTMADEIRNDVMSAVAQCKKAGIKVKILTGDNKQTALAVAKKLALLHDEDNALSCSEIEKMDDNKLSEVLERITVVSRSTPECKLRIVNLLKRRGYVVAVTGDGVNDSPAIKNADIGIAMGDGSDVTKECADIILLDNAFSVIVKAITFGRNIYRNFQRFLFFQLTVNISAVLLIISFLLLGFESPFTTVQLLWINVIMDGPLALSLGLEHRVDNLLEEKPVKRSDSLLGTKTLFRTIVHSIVISGVVILQKLYNFLKFDLLQTQSVVFCLFVTFQLFNAINARELGVKSITKSIGKNRAFSIILVLSILMQIIISEFMCNLFNTVKLGAVGWLKIISLCLVIVFLSEGYKWVYKKVISNKFFKKIIKRSKFA